MPEALSESREPVVDKSEVLEKDYDRARQLLTEAGYPDGKGFPKVRLLINRNEQQRVVAQAIAAMWRNILNIETEIVVRSWEDYEGAIRAGDFDVVRRGMVMQTTDELTNIRALFQEGIQPSSLATSAGQEPASKVSAPESGKPPAGKPGKLGMPPPIETESQALNDLSAVPIYFASSYALVKPYVKGFDSNVLDAPSLKTVRIDNGWKQPEIAGSNWIR